MCRSQVATKLKSLPKKSKDEILETKKQWMEKASKAKESPSKETKEEKSYFTFCVNAFYNTVFLLLLIGIHLASKYGNFKVVSSFDSKVVLTLIRNGATSA